VHVRERLDELRSLEATLSELQKACSDGSTVTECGILGGLSSEPLTGPGDAAINHIPRTHGPHS
jgi:hypothetical protein